MILNGNVSRNSNNAVHGTLSLIFRVLNNWEHAWFQLFVNYCTRRTCMFTDV